MAFDKNDPQAKSAKQDKPYFGFSAEGALFRSAAPIDNQTTNFLRWLVGEIEDEYLSPADARFLVLREVHGRDAFRETTLAKWETLDRFWQWPCAHGCTGAEEFVRSFRGTRQGLTDEWAWTKKCDAAEAKHGYAQRPRTPVEISALLEGIIGRAPVAAEAVDSWGEDRVPLEGPLDPDADINF